MEATCPECGTGIQIQTLPPNVFPPLDAEFFDPVNYVNLPAQGNSVIVIDFTVPAGRNGVIELFGNVVFGAGWTEGSGELTWRILKDGVAARNYESILASLGNVANPTKLGLRLLEGERIQVTLDNAAAPGGIPAGGQIVAARMHGWFYPKAHDESTLWR